MAHFEDLQPCRYGFPWSGVLLSIGWLEHRHVFAQGAVEGVFVERLRELLTDPWTPVMVMGYHSCEFCPPETSARGLLNLFIPSGDGVFVAPELVLHYVEAHRYRPPDVFIKAVMDCPAMGSEAYLAAVDRWGHFC